MAETTHVDRIALLPVADLMPYARNARTHSAAQIDQIVASIKEFRWTNPVLVDEANGIVAGHGRVLAAAKIYEAGGSIKTVSGGILPPGMVPVIVARGWTDTQKRAYVLADNKLALNAGWDDSLLRIEIGDLRVADFDLAVIGFSTDELDDIFATESAPSGAAKLGDIKFSIVVECADELQQGELLARLESEGLSCRALML